MRRIQLYSQVPDNPAAINWCRERSLLARVMLCPICNADMRLVPHPRGDGEIWECKRTVNRVRHSRRVSIRQGSMFTGSKLTIRTLIYMAYEWAVGTSVEQVSFQLEISDRAVSSWFVILRKTAAWFIRNRPEQQIGGEHEIVEVDECQIGRRKYHRGRRRNEVWVVGGISRQSVPPKLWLKVVRRRDRTTLISLIQRRVRAGSTVVTDGWSGYEGLGSFGYNHQVVNHSIEFVSAENPETHTQTIESLWCNLRRFLNLRRAYSRRHLRSYLKEFIFRKSACDVFETLISAVGAQYPL
jgi:transposase-like protein